jgi:hypothetical protein
MPNFVAAYAYRIFGRGDARVEETVSSRPEHCLRITGRPARVTFVGPNKKRLDLITDLFWAELLEEAGEERAGHVKLEC